jgi:hypothetical protein
LLQCRGSCTNVVMRIHQAADLAQAAVSAAEPPESRWHTTRRRQAKWAGTRLNCTPCPVGKVCTKGAIQVAGADLEVTVTMAARYLKPAPGPPGASGRGRGTGLRSHWQGKLEGSQLPRPAH